MKLESSKTRVPTEFEDIAATREGLSAPEQTLNQSTQSNSKAGLLSKLRMSSSKRNDGLHPGELKKGLGDANANANAKDSGPCQSTGISNRATAVGEITPQIFGETEDINRLKTFLQIDIVENRKLLPTPTAHDTDSELAEFSLIASLIQHTTGQYDQVTATVATLRQHFNTVLEKLRNSDASDEPRIEKILDAVHELFPHQVFATKILSKEDDGAFDQRPLLDDPSIFRVREKSVVLLKENNRYKAIVMSDQANANRINEISPDSRSENFFAFQIAQARSAAVDIEKLATANANRPATGPSSTSAISVVELTLAELAKIDVEKIHNAAPESINFISAVLRHATGIYNRDELSDVGLKFTPTDAELHSTEAEYVLSQLLIDDRRNHRNPKDPNELNLGEPGCQRTRFILQKINEMYGVKLNLIVHKPNSNGTLPMSCKVAFGPDEGIPVVLLHEGDTFYPVRKMKPIGNPELSPEKRNERKSKWGMTKAALADLRSPVRAKVRQLSEAQLIYRSGLIAPLTTFDIAARRELAKRTEPRRVLHGQKTLAQCIRTKIKLSPPVNPATFSGKSITELEKNINEHDKEISRGNSLYTGRNVEAMRKALAQAKIAAYTPNHANLGLNDPTTVPGSAIGEIETVRASFIQFKNKLADLESTWAVEALNPTAPWGQDENVAMLIKEINLFQLQAQVAFEKNSTAIFIMALKYGDKASTLIGEYKNISVKGSETQKMLAELQTDLNKMLQNLYEVGVNRFMPVDKISSRSAVYAGYRSMGIDEKTAWEMLNVDGRKVTHKNRSAEIATKSAKCATDMGVPFDSNLSVAELRDKADNCAHKHRMVLKALWEKLIPLNDIFSPHSVDTSNALSTIEKIQQYLISLEAGQAAEVNNSTPLPQEIQEVKQELFEEWTKNRAQFEQYFEKDECPYEELLEKGKNKLMDTLTTVRFDIDVVDRLVGENEKEQAKIDALIGYSDTLTEGMLIGNIAALSSATYETKVAKNQEALRNAFNN